MVSYQPFFVQIVAMADRFATVGQNGQSTWELLALICLYRGL